MAKFERAVIVYRVGQTYGEVWELRNGLWRFAAVTSPVQRQDEMQVALTSLADVTGEYGAAYEIAKELATE